MTDSESMRTTSQESKTQGHRSVSTPKRTDVFIIGLTGNLATGKTLVDDMLAARGSLVLDADTIAHEVERRGHPAFDAIISYFGREVVGADGELDRSMLGRRIFANDGDMAALVNVVHPAVREELVRRIRDAVPDSVVVLDAVKLLDGGAVNVCDDIWVVTCPEQLQIDRLVSRDGLSPVEAAQRVRSQGPQADKLRRATVVIDNSGTVEGVQKAVSAAWDRTAGRWLRARTTGAGAPEGREPTRS
jgi:dephospho-CoA kinase